MNDPFEKNIKMDSKLILIHKLGGLYLVFKFALDYKEVFPTYKDVATRMAHIMAQGPEYIDELKEEMNNIVKSINFYA